MTLLSIPEFAFRFHDSLVKEIVNQFPVEDGSSEDGNGPASLYISFLNSLGPLFLTIGYLREATPENIYENDIAFFINNYRDKFPRNFDLYEKVETGELFTNDPPFNAIEVLRDGERLGALVGKSFRHAFEQNNDLDPAIAARNITLAFIPILDDFKSRVRPPVKKKHGSFWSFLKK